MTKPEQQASLILCGTIRETLQQLDRLIRPEGSIKDSHLQIQLNNVISEFSILVDGIRRSPIEEQ